MPFFEQGGDDRGLFQANWILMAVHWTQGRSGAAEQVLPTLLRLAGRLGDPRRISTILHWTAGALVWGPTGAEDGVRRCTELLAEAQGSRFAEGSILSARSALEAMLGRAGDARASGAAAQGIMEDVSPTVFGTMLLATRLGLTEEILGDLEAAERIMRPAVDWLARRQEKAFLSTVAPQLGRLVAKMGRLDEAEQLARLGQETASPDDWVSQVLWREALALARAGRGDLQEAEGLAREAVALTREVDYLDGMARAWDDLARVLTAAGKTDQASAALGEALALWERKGNVVSAARTRQALSAP
jgi:tetratricopeptide (TPR) repeat protein